MARHTSSGWLSLLRWFLGNSAFEIIINLFACPFWLPKGEWLTSVLWLPKGEWLTSVLWLPKGEWLACLSWLSKILLAHFRLTVAYAKVVRIGILDVYGLLASLNFSGCLKQYGSLPNCGA